MTEIEIAYRKLGAILSVHHMGTPTEAELKRLLVTAYAMREELATAIEAAEKAVKAKA